MNCYSWASLNLAGRHSSALFRHSSALFRHSSAICRPNLSIRSVSQVSKLRNVGIVAHIDGGKTTTTERMLYYVGYTDRIGNVDQGSTVTDFLKTERERGITIQSACIPMAWQDHRINLIDTPGHVDFTIEVERSLRVLDGAIVILDGVKGVEAQTETVWKQANSYKIPRIIFINKMDRTGASFTASLQSVIKRLKGWGTPLTLQLPVFKGADDVFDSVLDVIELQHIDWKSDSKTGSIVNRVAIQDEHLLQKAQEAREKIIENLSDLDEEIVNVFMEHDGVHAKVPSFEIHNAIRRCTIQGSAVPVLCGASFKNMGVQPVLDAMIKYLPSPSDLAVPTAMDKSGKAIDVPLHDKPLVALAFKVTFDALRGPLVFVRVYSGTLEARQTVQISSYKTKQGPKERATKLLEMYADDFEEIPRIKAGNIGVVVGFKSVKTGDTLLSLHDTRQIKLHDISIPPAVFVRSVQVDRVSDEKPLHAALENLLREDPSLSLSINQETGQTLLSGMGELHLEIAGERLLEVYKAKCSLGAVNISYRETLALDNPFQLESKFEKDIFGKVLKCDITLLVSRIQEDKNVIDVSLSPFQIYQGSDKSVEQELGQTSGFGTTEQVQDAIEQGIQSALYRGPKLGFPISQLSIKCLFLGLYTPLLSSPAAIRAAAHACMREILDSQQGEILEPIMSIHVNTPSQYVGAISRDLSSHRRGIITSIDSDTQNMDDSSVTQVSRTVLDAKVPLSNLVGYASTLRGLSQGNGEWKMQIEGYSSVPRDQEEKLIKTIRGY